MSDITGRIAEIHRQHQYEFGFDTNCSCGAPGIWYWEDYIPHITAAVVEELGLEREECRGQYWFTTKAWPSDA